MPAAAPLTEAVHKDTIYITVVDKDRMAVSLIYSIFWGFGSGLASDRFGINFQNRGAGFTLQPGHPNEAGPGKRPMHTIIPGMLRKDGRVTMPFGVMGGAYQPCGHARLITNLVDYGMDPQSANDAPRCFTGAEGMQVERGYPDPVRARLAEMGHQVSIPDEPIGGCQAIVIGEDGVLVGASDGSTIAAIYAGSVEDKRVRGISLTAPHFFVEEETAAGARAAKIAYEQGDLKRRLARWHTNVDCAFYTWNIAFSDPEFKRTWGITELLPRIRVPMQILQGERDAYGTPEQLATARRLCTCPLETTLLPGIGHSLHREVPEVMRREVGAFVSRVVDLP